MKQTIKLLTIAFFILVLIFNLSPLGVQAIEKGRAVVVVIDRISISDLYNSSTPNIDKLLDAGAIGLMTTNTAGSRSQRDTYITMGAGTRAIGSEKSPLGLCALETYRGKTAKDLYKQNTHMSADEKSVINMGFAQTIRNNEDRPYTVNIGALGTVLRNGGLKTAVLGNCDTPGEYKRFLVSMFMDDKGIVPLGFVDSRYIVEDGLRPFGIKTDYEALLKDIHDLWDRADVISVQLGDTSRAEDFRYEATDEMNGYYKKVAIEESDFFIGALIEKIDLEKDLIMIITPLGSSVELAENNRLTPFIIAGKGIEKGLATSGSTRIPGIITNLDVGNTIINWFGLKPLSGQIGSPIRSEECNKGILYLVDYNKRLTEIFNHRYFLLRSYVVAQIILLIIAVALIIFKRDYLIYIKPVIVFLMTIPLVYLILPLFHHSLCWVNTLTSCLLAAFITAILFFSKIKSMSKIMLISLFTSVLLIADQWYGARLIKGSPLGYDIISGARFYGIGNEYMGILIGASCVVVGTLADIYSKRYRAFIKAFVVLFVITVVVTLAHPRLGVNVGGTASIVSTFAAYYILQGRKRINFRHLIYISGAVVAVLSLAFAIDSFRVVESQSHMGQTIRLIRQNGIEELGKIIYRKVSMNIKLFRYTIWTRVLLGSFIAIIILLNRPIGLIKELIMRFPNTFAALGAAIFGSVVAFITNDSGIVAAATSMIFVVPPLILLVIDELLSAKTTVQTSNNKMA